MDRLGDALLAGAALALDQDVRLAGRDGFDQVVDGLHLRRLPHQRAELAAARKLFLELLVLLLEGLEPLQPLEPRDDVVVEEGLLDVVLGALLDGGDGVLDARVGGDEDDPRRGLILPGSPKDLEAVGFGQANVGDDAVEGVGPEGLDGLLAVGHHRHHMAGAAEGVAEGDGDGPFVIREQNSHRARAEGRPARRWRGLQRRTRVSSYPAGRGFPTVPESCSPGRRGCGP